MTPDQQRIAIAKWCGWKCLRGETDTPIKRPTAHWFRPDGSPAHSWPCTVDNGIDLGYLPDYLNDLNAMHEAEGKLLPDQKDFYANSIIVPAHGPHWRFNCIHATAGQRAEALLKTIDKWTDNKR